MRSDPKRAHERLPSAALAAASRLLTPMTVALERMSLDELKLAAEAFRGARDTNCWWLIYALREVMPPIIAFEIQSRRADNLATAPKRTTP